MGKVYFISGIDTGIGKTVAVGMMCRSLQAAGRKWISVKMVQTGCRGFAEDLEVHRKLAGVGKFPEDEAGLTAPQIFGYPASPLLAARLEGGVVDLDGIARAVAEVARRYELVLVEGAGGLCVPLTEDELAIDFAAREGWPLILVTSGRLGAINHTLLSLEAAHARGIALAGIVMNAFPETDVRLFDDARAAVSRHLMRLGIACPVRILPDVASSLASVPDFTCFFGDERLGSA